MSSRDRCIDPATKDYQGTLRSVTQWDVNPAVWDNGLSVWDGGNSVFDSGSIWDEGLSVWDLLPAGPALTHTCDTRLYLALGTEAGSFPLNQALGSKLAGLRLKMLAQSEQALRVEVLRTLKPDIDARRLLEVAVAVSFPRKGWVLIEVDCIDGLSGQPVSLGLHRPL